MSDLGVLCLVPLVSFAIGVLRLHPALRLVVQLACVASTLVCARDGIAMLRRPHVARPVARRKGPAQPSATGRFL